MNIYMLANMQAGFATYLAYAGAIRNGLGAPAKLMSREKDQSKRGRIFKPLADG
jgi:hypothetical protein